MGQKIHPIGFRLSVQKNWTSKWYANSKNFSGMLLKDIEVREYLKKRLFGAGVSKIIIERPAKNAKITIYTARPGVVIGKKGEDIETLRAELRKRMGLPDVALNIEEVRKPEVDAQLIAKNLIDKEGKVSKETKQTIEFEMEFSLPTPGIIVKGCLDDCDVCEPALKERMQLENDLLRKQIELLEKSQEYRCCPPAPLITE